MALLNSYELPMGWEAPDFHLRNTEGDEITPAKFASSKGLLVVFTCNHCPYAKASWPLLVELYEKFGSEVGFVAINPNDDQSHPEDSYEQMKEKKVEWNIGFDYVQDPTQKVAKEYQAQCTPDPYLFKLEDGKWKLYYHGRINDNWQDPSLVQDHDLENAMSALIKDEQSPSTQKPSMGCSIKWRS